jgi:septum formation protein
MAANPNESKLSLTPTLDGVPQLILASGSPRRLMLLKRFGIECLVSPADIDEAPRPEEPPEAYVSRLAIEKALAVQERLHAQGNQGFVVLAADTTVALEGRILGKPEDADDAIRTLTMLSNRRHQVHTGIAVATPTDTYHRVVTSIVTMSTLDQSLIEWYVQATPSKSVPQRL